MFKLEFYVPETHVDGVKDAIFKAGGGKIGNYDCCCWQIVGKGQFRACEGSNPFIGEKGEIEEVSEFKVEMICSADNLQPVIEALKKAHPYETPAYQYWQVQV